MLALVVSCSPAWAQQQRTFPADSSDLAAENLNRVAASAQQIEEVLRKEPGLLVELKRWVAKEATDRGQIVDDAELTEQGIFDRLSRDLEFRAVATRLLQRYGYLLPKPNPGSEAAAEQQLLLQERQRQLQKALAEEEKPASTERETRVATTKKERVRPTPPPPDHLPLPTSPRNPLEDMDLRSHPLLQTTAERLPGLSPRLTDSLAPVAGASRTEDERSTMAAELRERGAVSSAPPETAMVKPSRPLPGSNANEAQEDGAIQPALLHRPNPYADIPSLYDMYRQEIGRAHV